MSHGKSAAPQTCVAGKPANSHGFQTEVDLDELARQARREALEELRHWRLVLASGGDPEQAASVERMIEVGERLDAGLR